MKIQDGRKIGMWFEPPYPGCEKRTYPIDIFTSHWTGGEADKKSPDDDFARVYTVLKNRHDKDGKPTPLSIHFIINSADGILQCADPLKTVCYHAGKVNPISMGVEIVNPGNGEERDARPRKNIVTKVRGKELKQCVFLPGQLDAYLFLCEHVAKTYGIPKVVPPDVLLSGSEAKSFRGFLEHYQVSSKKVDAGGQLNAHLLASGWSLDGDEPKPKPKKSASR